MAEAQARLDAARQAYEQQVAKINAQSQPAPAQPPQQIDTRPFVPSVSKADGPIDRLDRRGAMRTTLTRLHRDERGMSLVFVGVGFMAFLAATTLAIDVGMFATARSQAQNSADAGALSGAVALYFDDYTTERRAGLPSRARSRRHAATR